MDVRPGYKRTEVGVIPEDWKVRPLRRLASIRTGIARNAAVVPANPIRVPLLRVANVQDGYLDLSELVSIAIERSDLQRFGLQPGDVLMNEGGDLDKLGRGTLWSGAIDPCVHQNHVFAVRCGPDLVPSFLDAWSATSQARRYFLIAGKQTTNLASVNKTALGGLPVVVPSKPEQEAIAAVLTDADVLIESLECLLAKKRQLKQAVMHQLLTGKTRLPRFTGEWRTRALGRPENFLKGAGIAKADASSGPIPCIRYGELYTDHQHYVTSYRSRISAAVAEGATRLVPGDLLFAASGETKAEIGKCAAFVDDVEAYAGGDILILRGLEGDPIFLGHYLNFGSIRRQMTSLGQGDAVVHISARSLASIEAPFPLPGEQKAIGEVLLAHDADIRAAEQRLRKAEAVRDGCSDELLSGRSRLRGSRPEGVA